MIEPVPVKTLTLRCLGCADRQVRTLVAPTFADIQATITRLADDHRQACAAATFEVLLA